MPLTTAIAATYVADKFLTQFLKEEGYGGLKKLFFPEKKYKNELGKIILETVEEYESKYPIQSTHTKFPFYHSQLLFDVLNKHILFREPQSPLSLELFQQNPNIMIPDQGSLEVFYEMFTNRIKSSLIISSLYINENYKTQIYGLNDTLAEISQTSNRILEKVENIENSVGAVNKQIAQLRDQLGGELTISDTYHYQGLEVQPKVDKISNRKNLVDEIESLFKNSTWVALNGSISTGKTQISILVAERFANAFWIDLKYNEGLSFTTVLKKELSAYLKIDEKVVDLNTLIQNLPVNSIIVFDDLPKIQLDKTSLISFNAFLNAIEQKEIKCISTSNYSIPVSIRELLQDSVYTEKKIPYLNNDEIEDILIAYGSGVDNAKLLKDVISVASEGHPAIVNAICRYLIDKKWEVGTEELSALFTNKYASELDESTYEKILKTITEQDSRDLLYRLKLVIGKIKNPEVDTVSAVKPGILQPYEKITGLNGLWIQKPTIDSYELSPLINKISDNNLSPALYKAINIALGRLAIRNKIINQFEATRAIHYFIRGQAYNRAGFILSLALQETLAQDISQTPFSLELFWLGTPLPEQMDLYLKSTIRYLQINIQLKRTKNVEFLIKDLEEIVEKSTTQGINVAPSSMVLAVFYSDKDPGKANKYLLLAIGHIEQLKFIGEQVPLPDELFNVEVFIWNNLIRVNDSKEFGEWFAGFSQLNDDQIKNSLSNELSHIACLIFCSKLYDSEQSKKAPDWHSLLNLFDEILLKISTYEVPTFIACIIKYKIKVYGANLKQLETAKELTSEFKLLIEANNIASFIINDELGRQLFYNDKKEEALPVLFKAADIEVSNIFTEKADTYLVISEILSYTDKNAAARYAAKAYTFQDKNPFIEDVVSAKILGEYVISLWESGKSKEVFYILAEGLEKLLVSYKPLDNYKGTIIRYGHILNYYYHLTAGLKLNDIGGEPYMIPFRGWFSRNNDRLLEGGYYFEQRKFMLAFLMVQSFEQIADIKMAKKWAYQCYTISDNEEAVNPFSAALALISPLLILDDKYEEPIIKEISVMKMIKELNAEGTLVEKVGNEHLAKIMEDRPRIQMDSFDSGIFEFKINYIIIRVLSRYIETNDTAIITRFLSELERIKLFFDSPRQIEILSLALELMISPEGTEKDILSLFDPALDLPASLQGLLYIIASLISSSDKAYGLHLAMIQRLELVTKGVSYGGYRFIVVAFFERFWLDRIEKHPEEFSGYALLKQKGVSQILETEDTKKIKKIFTVLSFHLNYVIPQNIETWLYSDL